MPLYQQQGVALIMALVIVAVASAVAVHLARQQQIAIQRVANLLDRDQAQLYALGAENWAKRILQEDDKSVDHTQETWATPLQPVTIEGGQIAGHLEDLQGRFNVNNLWDFQQQRLNLLDWQRFQRLLDYLQLDTKIAAAVVDWLDPDVNPVYPDGVEELEYLRLQPAYRTHDGPFADPSELRLIAGMDQASYERLLPHISTLPAYTNININTATEAVLASLSTEAIEATALKSWLKQRRAFNGVAQFLQDPFWEKAQLDPSGLAVNSHYFVMHARVQWGSSQLYRISQFYRTPDQLFTLVRKEYLF